LYVGISNYPAALAEKAIHMLKAMGTPCLIHQPKYSMFERTPEQGLLDVLGKEKVGCIAFSPLAQGLLTDKYLNGIPEQSRAARHPSLKPEQITPQMLNVVKCLNDLAQRRGQKLAEMAVAWLLRDDRVTSVLIGASKVSHVMDAYNALNNISFSGPELEEIDEILKGL